MPSNDAQPLTIAQPVVSKYGAKGLSKYVPQDLLQQVEYLYNSIQWEALNNRETGVERKKVFALLASVLHDERTLLGFTANDISTMFPMLGDVSHYHKHLSIDEISKNKSMYQT